MCLVLGKEIKMAVSDLVIYWLIVISGRKIFVHIYSMFLKEQSSFLCCVVVVMIF